MANNASLLDILLDLDKDSRSGVLRVERGAEKKQLVLSKGSLAFAESNRPEEHLARIMVNLGFLPQNRVNEIASLMKSGKTSEEAILELCPSGLKDFEKGRREQAILILASLLGWNNCSMHFYPGEGLVRFQLNLSLSLPELLVLSTRRAVSDRLIETPPNFLQQSFSLADKFAGRALVFPLNGAESYAYSLLHESANAADILPLISSTEAKPEELLLRLYVLGLVTPRELGEPSGETPASAGPSSLVQQLDDMTLQFETAGLYEILSIPADASPDQIQAAYHDLAKQFHPDRFQSSEFSADIRAKAQKVFACINEAYTTLRDPVFRADYDAKRLTKESKVETELKARAAKQSEDEKTAEELFRDGRALLAKGEFEKAIDRLKGCIWLYPEKAAYHHYLGVAQSEIPKFRKSAEQHLLKAVALDNTSVASHLELAKLYIKVMLRRKAELQLKELLRWDPQNPEAKKLFVELKRLESAKASKGSIKSLFSRS
jgi:curved DNA-binding protein CbpA